MLALVMLGMALLPPAGQPAASADAVFAPLWLYNGTWQVTKSGGPAKPDILENKCAVLGKYFACEQTVNGAPTELLVFIPAKTSGSFFTQSIMPDGRAGGRGDLKIEGDHWTYSSYWNQGGKTTFYKTLNVFTGKTRIHFEQQESNDNTDNKQWKTTASGDEVRTAAGRVTAVH